MKKPSGKKRQSAPPEKLAKLIDYINGLPDKAPSNWQIRQQVTEQSDTRSGRYGRWAGLMEHLISRPGAFAGSEARPGARRLAELAGILPESQPVERLRDVHLAQFSSMETDTKESQPVERMREFPQPTKEENFGEIFAALLGQMSALTREFINAPANKSEMMGHSESLERYDDLLTAKELLSKIAQGNHNLFNICREKHLPTNEEFIRSCWQAHWDNPNWGYYATAKLKLDEYGLLEWKPNIIYELLKGTDPTRIRKCPVCNIIFWAKKFDQPCCTPQHSHALRNKRWYDKYQTKYKQQRINKANEQEKQQREGASSISKTDKSTDRKGGN